MNYSNGAELIRKERERQITAEGFDAEHDAAKSVGELSCAAGAYAMAAAWQQVYPDESLSLPTETPPMWPESMSANLWWKPSKDPVRNLVKAGALIAAEIDRIQRALNTSQQ